MPILGIMASQISVHLTPPSSFYSIATLSLSGVKTGTFTSIPSTYKSLQLRFNVIDTIGYSSPWVQFNGDTSTNYTSHWLYGDGTSVSAGGFTAIAEVYLGGVNTNNTVYPLVGVVDIVDYASTSKNKTVRQFVGNNDNGAGNGPYVAITSGLWINTSAISSIKFFNGSSENWAAGSTVSLYGVK